MAAVFLAAPFGFGEPQWTWVLNVLAVVWLLSFVAKSLLMHLRRAQRMMAADGKPGGYVHAALWAIRNGDLAIRIAYANLLLVTVLLCLLLNREEGSVFGPGFVLGRNPLMLIVLAVAMLLTSGQMGRARFLPSRQMDREPTIAGWAYAALAVGLLALGSGLLGHTPRPDTQKFLLSCAYLLFVAFLGSYWWSSRMNRRDELRRALSGPVATAA